MGSLKPTPTACMGPKRSHSRALNLAGVGVTAVVTKETDWMSQSEAKVAGFRSRIWGVIKTHLTSKRNPLVLPDLKRCGVVTVIITRKGDET